MRILTALLVLVALGVLYAAFIREWLSNQPWAAPFFKAVEPIELWLWKKSETILFARLKVVTGLLLTVLTQAGTIDITPLMPFIPDRYEGIVQFFWNMLPLSITIIGLLDEKMRWGTTKPVELVAVNIEQVPEHIRQAIIDAELAKREAVSEVVAAKQAGEIA